jgi:hypothetical protein
MNEDRLGKSLWYLDWKLIGAAALDVRRRVRQRELFD